MARLRSRSRKKTFSAKVMIVVGIRVAVSLVVGLFGSVLLSR